MTGNIKIAIATGLVTAVITPALGYELNERLSVNGVLAGAVQCQELSDAPGFDDTCEGAAPFQPEVSFRPSDRDELFLKLGFASGDGINGHSPFINAPWAADLEDDVKDINGRDRDHLLTAWYKHRFDLNGRQALAVTVGIIDSTDYLDENAYGNDEYTQFMNATLTNGPNVFLPSYDRGMAVEWSSGPWAVNGVYMNVGENRDGNDHDFYGGQVHYRANTSTGSGNYRLIVAHTSRDFLDPTARAREDRSGLGFSIDQELGGALGAWLRVGWQVDDAAVNYDSLYSGGADISGSLWGREGDNIGLGVAYLDGGNRNIAHTHVAEAYYRWQQGPWLGVTADIQYQRDRLRDREGPSGWTVGVRTVVEF